MFGLDSQVIIITALVMASVIAVGYGIFFNSIEVKRKADDRVSRMATTPANLKDKKAANDRLAEISKRKKSVQDSLKQLEEQQNNKAKRKDLKERLAQAGLSTTPQQYYIYSAILGLVGGGAIFVASANIFIAAGMVFVFGVGVPAWALSFITKRRYKAFLEEFPNSLDVMVRSIKSGLPLNDAVRLIASEAREPIRSEFTKVVEEQQVGFSIPEACQRMFNRVPLPEVNFFSVVVNIQAQAGGNLSEALGNLSTVLRMRKQMKAKVKAMSMEAKASAAIIGSLPFVVTFLVYLTAPDYILLLFTDPRGHLIIGVSLVWMSIGVLVMRKMIDFEV